MPQEYQEPTLIEDSHGSSIETHPAYGVVTVTRPQSNPGATLFGSDLQHQHFISVQIQTAVVKRDLNRDWTHPRKTILEFNMTEAQWAKFVSGAGRSQATPVTLDMVTNGDLAKVPAIKTTKVNRKDQFNEEFQQKLKEALDSFNTGISKLKELSEQKSVSKVALRDIVRSLEINAGNLPSNLNFAVSSFKEVSENIVEEAKAEVEAYLQNAAQQAGLKVLVAEAPQLHSPPQLPEFLDNPQ